MNRGNQALELKVHIDQIERLLMFDYEPGSGEALFDLCTHDGQILRSGEVKGPVTHVRIADLPEADMILMVLDGDQSVVRPVHLRKAV